MSGVFATFRGINRQFQFIEQNNGINLRILNLKNKLQKILSWDESTQLPNPLNQKFSSIKDHIQWLERAYFHIHEKDDMITFHEGLVGVKRDEESIEVSDHLFSLEDLLNQKPEDENQSPSAAPPDFDPVLAERLISEAVQDLIELHKAKTGGLEKKFEQKMQSLKKVILD